MANTGDQGRPAAKRTHNKTAYGRTLSGRRVTEEGRLAHEQGTRNTERHNINNDGRTLNTT
eukprot:10374006-Alexandrium_andersonii.AAC.1